MGGNVSSLPRVYGAWVEVIHDNLTLRRAGGEFSCPEYIQQLGDAVSVHGVLVPVLLVQLLDRILCRLLCKFGEHVRLGRGEGQARWPSYVPGGFLQRRKQRERKQRRGEVVHLETGFEAVRGR